MKISFCILWASFITLLICKKKDINPTCELFTIENDTLIFSIYQLSIHLSLLIWIHIHRIKNNLKIFWNGNKFCGRLFNTCQRLVLCLLKGKKELVPLSSVGELYSLPCSLEEIVICDSDLSLFGRMANSSTHKDEKV